LPSHYDGTPYENQPDDYPIFCNGGHCARQVRLFPFDSRYFFHKSFTKIKRRAAMKNMTHLFIVPVCINLIRASESNASTEKRERKRKRY
jgi:hypothetical protein